MHSSGSIIKTYCEKVRHYLDDPDIDAKYDDNYLVRFFLSSAMTDVIGRVSMMADNQIICMLTISVVNGTTYYKLPPSVKQVLRIGVQDPNTGWFTEDFRPRNEFHLAGPGWALEGNLLAFRPTPSEAKNYLVMYVPSGDIGAHHGITGTLNANGTFTLASAPNIGSLDKRDNAYAGSYIRILGANITDELIITSHDPVTRIVTLRNPPANAAGTYTYEVIPFLMEPMTDAIAISAAMRAGVGRKINQVTMQNLALAYKQAIKTAHDTIGNMNSRIGKSFTKTIQPVGGLTIGTGGSAASPGGGGSASGVAGGDLSGTYPNPVVDGIQGRPVSSSAPTGGQTLVWNSSTNIWEPNTASGSGISSLTLAANIGSGTPLTGPGTLTFTGATNQIDTVVAGNTVLFSLPNPLSVNILSPSYIQFPTTVSPSQAQATQHWDSTWETLALGLDANVNLKHGQQLYLRVYNSTGSSIPRGSPVVVSGQNSPISATVVLANASLTTTTYNFIGIAAEEIGNNQTGFVQTSGYMTGLDTSGYSGAEGSFLYLSNTPGSLTSTAPTRPNIKLRVGYLVKKASGTAGSILVAPDQGANSISDLESIAATRLVGRRNNSSGSPEEISLGTGLKMAGTVLSANTSDLVSTSTSIVAGTGLTGGTQTLASNVNIGVDFAANGTSSSTKAVRADDNRLSNSRTPTSHKASHSIGGSDAIIPGDIGAAAASHTHAAGDIISGILNQARLGSGTPSNATFLRGDQVWATVTGTGVADANYGDISVTSTGALWTIQNNAVTLAKMADIATNTLIGRATSGTGDPETITCTAAGRALLDDADAAAQLTTLGAAAASHTHAAGDITSGVFNQARLGTGTADNTTYLRGDGTWATVSGSGSGSVTSITPAADTGTGTAITTTGTITVAGTANEVETSVSGTTVTVGLPSAITVTEVNTNFADFNTGVVSPTDQVGREYWDANWETLSLGLDANVNLKQGQQLYLRARNNSASQINKGSVVYVSGHHSVTEATIALADADNENTSANTIGVAAENIAANTSGFVQTFGYMTGLTTNNSQFSTTEGTPFYLSTVAGETTPTLPAAPKHGVRVGFLVKRAGSPDGSIFINIQNYQELEELSDVLIGTKAEQDLLSWDNTAGVWKNRTFAAAGVASITDLGDYAPIGHTHGAGDIQTGTLALARGGTGANLSSTGGLGFVLKQDSAGGNITSAALLSTDLPAHNHNATDINSGTLAIARGGTNLGTTPTNGQLLIGNGTGYTLATLTAGSGVTITNSSGSITIASTGGSGGGTKTYAVFTPLDAQPPATNFATLDTRNSIAVLEFDGGTTDESTTFVGVMPEAAVLTSGLKVEITWMADTATSGNVRWGVQFERMNTNLGSDSFDTATEGNSAANGTSGIPSVLELTCTAIDGITAGDTFRLKIYREASDTTNDTMSGDAQLISVEVRSAA